MVDVQKIEEYQYLLNKLPGILNSRIVVGQSGSVTEIHILSDTSRNPKQIVRDVQSALLASSNVSIDHKVISVAQVESDKTVFREFRLGIDSIHLFSTQSKVEARVKLKRDEQVFGGSSTGGNSSQGRIRVVSEATLNAVQQFLKKEFLFVLSDVVRVTLAERKVIAVSVLYFTDKGDEYLSGSAFIHNDESEAVVKATLDAINRKLIFHCDTAIK